MNRGFLSTYYFSYNKEDLALFDMLFTNYGVLDLTILLYVSVEECINILKEKQYDLILMDIMMPGMSGDETLLKLKKDPSFNIPVIAVTADVESGSEKNI